MCDLEDKGFEVKCLNCGSTEVELLEDYDEYSDGELYSLGTYFYCKDCGQRS